MDARTHNLNTVFGQERRHEVPLYQRPYVWEQTKQWEPLWEDVRDLAERAVARETIHGHFMGAIVMEAQPAAYGRTDSWLVIDGQQRLTTLQLLLAAIRDVARTRHGSEHPFTKALAALTANEQLIQNPDDRFKVWPTNRDRDDFKLVLLGESVEDVRQKLAALKQGQKAAGKKKAERHHRIVDAYLYFADQADSWLEEDPANEEQRMQAILEIVRRYVHVVVIELVQKDDAQVIFETLNARGTPLLPADLVKSYLLREIERSNGDVPTAYEQFWKRFDDEENGWREEVLQGRQQRTRIDLFLQHYLTLKTGSEVPVTRVYDAFREWVERQKTLTPMEHLADLCSCSEVYASFEGFSTRTAEGRFFERLRYLEMSTPLPFLLELFRRFGADVDAVPRRQILNDIESFLVRRLVCRLNTRGYNRLFLDLLGCIAADAATTAMAVRAELQKGQSDSTRWPDDQAVLAAWMIIPAYRALARGRVRMVLEAIERSMVTKEVEKLEFTGALTVEHVMPRKWAKYWPLPEGDAGVREVEREQLIHTFGNLTLLTDALNASISNGPWLAKRDALKTKSRLLVSADLKDAENWDEAEIVDRTKRLCDKALAVWPKALPVAASTL